MSPKKTFLWQKVCANIYIFCRSVQDNFFLLKYWMFTMQSDDSSLVHWTQSKANPGRKSVFKCLQIKVMIVSVTILNISFHHESIFGRETFLWKFNKDCSKEDETGKSHHGRSNICLKSRVRFILKILYGAFEQSNVFNSISFVFI